MIEPFSIVGILVIILLIYLAIEVVIHYIHFVFFSLLLFLAAVYFFGITFGQIMDFAARVLMWVV